MLFLVFGQSSSIFETQLACFAYQGQCSLSSLLSHKKEQCNRLSQLPHSKSTLSITWTSSNNMKLKQCLHMWYVVIKYNGCVWIAINKCCPCIISLNTTCDADLNIFNLKIKCKNVKTKDHLKWNLFLKIQQCGILLEQIQFEFLKQILRYNWLREK